MKIHVKVDKEWEGKGESVLLYRATKTKHGATDISRVALQFMNIHRLLFRFSVCESIS